MNSVGLEMIGAGWTGIGWMSKQTAVARLCEASVRCRVHRNHAAGRASKMRCELLWNGWTPSLGLPWTWLQVFRNINITLELLGALNLDVLAQSLLGHIRLGFNA